MLEKIGKNIKSLFIQEVEDKPAGVTEQRSTGNEARGASPGMPDATGTGKVDMQKMMDRLSDILASRNQEGFDYLEYRNAIMELIQTGQSEENAFVSVYTTAKTLGITKKALVDSAKYYLSVLSEESKEFTDEIKSRQQSDIAEKEQAIEKIKNDIEQLLKDKGKLEKDVAESKVKVGAAGASFNAAYEKISSKINEDIKKMDQYVKEGR
jgi:hypothetical protein